MGGSWTKKANQLCRIDTWIICSCMRSDFHSNSLSYGLPFEYTYSDKLTKNRANANKNSEHLCLMVVSACIHSKRTIKFKKIEHFLSCRTCIHVSVIHVQLHQYDPSCLTFSCSRKQFLVAQTIYKTKCDACLRCKAIKFYAKHMNFEISLSIDSVVRPHILTFAHAADYHSVRHGTAHCRTLTGVNGLSFSFCLCAGRNNRKANAQQRPNTTQTKLPFHKHAKVLHPLRATSIDWCCAHQKLIPNISNV